jgi:Leucine-rich repeat (LRR) protein
MNITVHGIKPVRSNILHFSKDGLDFATAGSRMPAIYLAANSSVLVFAVGQEVYNLTALVVGQETFVAFKCYDENRVRVSYHGKEVSVFEPKTHRMSGYANFYLGNPWEEPADVSVNTLRFFDRAEIRWKGRNKSNETYGAVLTEEPIPSWAYEETQILQEIYSANGFKLPQLTNGVVCHNRSIDLRVFRDVCSNGYLQSLWFMGFKLLPESIGKLQYLKELHITNGDIKVLPASIGNLSSLEKL